ncbi:Hypothetical protein UVM_LOCUS100, partial [uncultured virus]
VQDDRWLYVPRQYGLQHFDARPTVDETRVGEPSDRLQFVGTLSDSMKQVRRLCRPEQRIVTDTMVRLQTEALAAILERLRSPCGGAMLSLPPGYGKTVVALKAISELGRRALVVVHKEFLVEQWRERIAQFLPNARVGHLQVSRRLYVRTL